MLMFSASVEGLIKDFSEVLEMLGLESTKGFNILSCEFKRKILLKLHSFSWQVAHEKTIVNMKDTSVLLNHYIPIVTIFHL